MDRFLFVQPQIDWLLALKPRIIVVIDGNCNAGKTSLANKLTEIYACNIFHMDDFFLHSEQRTADRFAEIGGNPYNLKILLTVDKETQRQRIPERTVCLHKRFFEEWIPMKNRYFDGFDIPAKCDLVIRLLICKSSRLKQPGAYHLFLVPPFQNTGDDR